MAVKSKAVSGHVGNHLSYIRNSRSLFMRRYIQQHIRPVSTRDVGYVGVRRQRVHDRLARLNLAQRNEALSGPLQRLGNRLRCLCFSLRTNDGSLTLLLGLGVGSEHIRKYRTAAHLLNDKLGTLSILLCDLFGLNGLGEFLRVVSSLTSQCKHHTHLAKRQVGNGHVLKLNVELPCTLKQVCSNT